MIPVRQSTAFEVAVGPVLDASGVAVTDCVVGDFKLKKTTGNFAALNGSATLTHVSAGMYDLVLTTSDVDTVGLATVAIDDTTNGCAPIYMQVVEEAVYDMLFASSAVGYIANAPVNVVQVSGSAPAADNQKIVYDTDFAANYNTTADKWNTSVTHVAGTSVSTSTAQFGVNVVNFGGSAGTFSSGRPEVNATHWGGTAVASATVSANMTQVSGDSGAADNLEAAFDGTGYRAKLYLHEKNCLTFPVSVVNSTTSFDLDVPGGLLAIPDYTDWQVIIRDISNNPPSVAHVARVTATSENTPGNPTITISAAASHFTVAVNDIVELYPPELEVLTRIPNATPAANGGLPTVNASNYVAGVQGTINTLDALDTAQDTQHSSTQTLITTVDTVVDAIAAVLTGITSLAQWLGLIAGKQTGNSTARTEIRATGAGSGTYDETTDSQEAARDNMGTAQTGDAYAIVNNGTYGNSALKTAIDGVSGAYVSDSGTAQAGAAGTLTLRSAAVATDDYYNYQILTLTGGTGAGQARIISDYVGSTKVATVNGNWAATPDNTTTYTITAFGQIPGASAPTAAEVADAVWDESTTGHTTSGTFGYQTKTALDAKATAAALATAQTDLDTITGSDGVTLATSQPNAEAFAGSDMGVAIAALDTKLGIPNVDIATDIENVSGGDSASLMASTTIATLTSQTVFTLSAGSSDNDAYNGGIAVFTDQSTSTQKSFVPIKDYVGSTKKVTLLHAPKFTIATGDTVKVVIDAKPLLTAEFVDRNHTFRFDNSRQTTAPNRITENTSFDGLIKMDFTNVLDSDDSLATINSVSISPTSGDEPTLGTASLHTDGVSVIIPVACTEDGDPCDTGTYTITVSVTSADAQTYSRAGKLIVESA